MAPLCEITFENKIPGSTLFWCGEKLRCNIVLNLSKPRMMKGIYVTISGWAKCSWTERTTYGSIRVTTYYSGKEGYIDSVTYLVGSETSDVSELPAGVHTYSFVYDIPPNLPSSVEGDKGNIRYDVQVTINRPFPLIDDNFKEVFTLVKPLDLNLGADLMTVPFNKELTNTFYCLSCKSAPFTAVANIPQIGYTPGELIKVKIDANNGSNVAINAIKTSLCQIIKCYSDSPAGGENIQFKKVATSIIPGIQKNEEKSYELALKIPLVPPTDEESSKTIHVTYCVEIKFKTSFLHLSPFTMIPIIIGTVPIRSNTIDTVPNLILPVVDDIYDNPTRLKQNPPADDEVRDKIEDFLNK